MGATIERALATIAEMLTDRGCPPRRVPAPPRPSCTGSGYGDIFDVDMGSALVAFRLAPKPATALREIVASWADSEDDEHHATVEHAADRKWVLVVIAEAVPATKLASIIAQFKVSGVMLQVFLLNELAFNVSRHKLVPKHTLASDEEVATLLRRMGLRSKSLLPLILRNDPMARYLGLRAGDVVRIERPSPTAGTHVLYRCCV